jgi:hypothetical protein
MSTKEEILSKCVEGQWLFSCAMKPDQFKSFINGSTDDFITMRGAHHSIAHCSLHPISEEYAQFFIKHELWSLYPEPKEGVTDEAFQNRWETYEKRVRDMCELHNIKYEGY